MIIDGNNMVAGRLASKVAKEIKNNENIIVLNCEKIMIVGNNSAIMPKFQQRVDASVKSNPHYGPKYDRIPSKMFRRMVKGMLPNKSRTAERMIKQLETFNDIPEKYQGKEMTKFEGIEFSGKNKGINLGEIAKKLGGKW
jgi:large subunit ribosomal protein L13